MMLFYHIISISSKPAKDSNKLINRKDQSSHKKREEYQEDQKEN